MGRSIVYVMGGLILMLGGWFFIGISQGITNALGATGFIFAFLPYFPLIAGLIMTIMGFMNMNYGDENGG